MTYAFWPFLTLRARLTALRERGVAGPQALSRLAVLLAALGLLSFGFSSAAYGQESSFPLRVEADDGSAVRLTLGVDPDATSGVDDGEGSTENIGETSLPPLGTTVFQARFTSDELSNVDLSDGVSRDIREKTASFGDPFSGSKTHEVTFVIPSGSGVTLDWDLPAGAEGQLSSQSGLSETLSGDNQTSVSTGDLTEVTGPGNANTYRATLEMTYNNLTGGGPEASGDQFQVTEDQPEDLDVRPNDSDPEGDPLRPSVVDGEGPDNGTVSFNSADSTFTYNPDEDFNGTDAFTYEAADGFGGRAEADVTVNVSAVNDAPTVSTNSGLTLDEGATSSVTTGELSASDVDDAASDLTFSVTSGPSNGTLLVGGAQASSFTQQDLESGSVEYAHNGSETTSDSFTFDLTDDDGAGPSGVKFDITIEPVNDPPAISSVGDQAIDEDQQLGPLDFTVSDPETSAENLTLSGTSDNADLVPDDSIELSGPDANGNASVTVTPSADSNGTAGIELSVSDGEKSATSTFNLAVRSVNDPPEVVGTIPDDTLEVPGPPVSLTGLAATVFEDPDGDALSLSASSGDCSVVDIRKAKNPQAVRLHPLGTGGTEVTVTASDGSGETGASFQVTVVSREGEEPASQASAIVNASREGKPIDLGDTGNKVVPRGIKGEGTIEARRFGSEPSDVAGIAERNVSQFRTVIDARGGLEIGSGTEVRFAVGSFPGLDDPSGVFVYRRPEAGNGTFEKLATSVDENGTPGDRSDDEIVAETSSFSEFALAANFEPLPVEMARFDAVAQEGSVRLTWETASETKNAGFEVQRKSSGDKQEDANWQKVGFVESKAEGGTTTEAQTYRYVAEDLPVGSHQFRLKQVDLDGSAALTDPVTAEVRMQEAVKLTAPAPNPASVSARLSFAVKEQSETRITLYNMLGQQVATVYEGTPPAEEEKRLQIDAAGLPSGTYFLRLEANGKTVTERLTVVQ